MKKLICWLTLLCLALLPTLSALAEAPNSTHTIESKQMTFYYGDLDTKMENTIYFIDGTDVPYLSLADWAAILDGPEQNDADGDTAEGDTVEGETAGDTVEGDTGDAPAEEDTAEDNTAVDTVGDTAVDTTDALAEGDTADAPAEGDTADAPSDEELTQMLQDS
jgi:hypothetical protein